MAATIRAELGLWDDDQEKIAANMIDREFATAQGKLDGFALEHSAPARSGSRKEREVLFDGLCGACELSREGMTVMMKRTIAVALTQIMAVTPGLTVKEIVLRAREYRRKHPTWHMSPMSLAKHWGTCAVREGIKGLLDEPAGWRAHHTTIFPEGENGASGAYFATKPWESLGRPFQEKIMRWSANQRAAATISARRPHSD